MIRIKWKLEFGNIFIVQLLIFPSILQIILQVSGEHQYSDNSAVLARIRQLRQEFAPTSRADTMETRRRSFRPIRETTSPNPNDQNRYQKPKAKRYRCYLVDDEEESEIEEVQIVEPQDGQKSFFAQFQQQKGLNDKKEIMGWEGRVDIGENGRRSEGTRPRYFFGERRTTEGPSEGMKNVPIIEYIDYETIEGRGQQQSPEMNNKSSVGSEMPAIEDVKTAQRTTNIAKSPQINRSKIQRQPLPQKYSVENEGKSTGGTDEEDVKDNSNSHEIDDQELYNDLYITTTASSNSKRLPPPKAQQGLLKQPGKMPKGMVPPPNSSSAGPAKEQPKQVLKSSPNAGGNPREISPAKEQQRPIARRHPPKAIPHEFQSEEEESEESNHEIQSPPPASIGIGTQQNFQQPFDQPKPSNQQQQSSQFVVAPNYQLWPLQNAMSMRQSTQQQRGERPRDSQGRPLILSPEHCKMIDNYAQLYGLRAPANVISFVHNNCAFAKVYLPAASCAEIDHLVGSCYRQRN